VIDVSTFDRNSSGTFQNNSSVYSVFHGTDSYLLEDELNESQWNQIEKNALKTKEQYTNGLLKKFTINAPSYDNFFSINSNDNNPLSFLIDGHILRVGENNPGGLPDGLTAAQDTLIFLLNAADAATRTDLVFLEVWFEVIGYHEMIRKFGGDTTPALINNIYDARINVETTRRIQFRWRTRSINSESLMTNVNAFKYDNVDSGVTYTAYNDIYIADTGVQYITSAGKNSLKSNGIVYGIPLFTVARKASNDAIDTVDITDISPKTKLVDGFVKDFVTNPVNLQQNANNRLVTDAQITSWNNKYDASNIGTAASKDVGTSSGNLPVLDASGKLDTAILPGLSLTTTNVVASQAEMLALTAEPGDLAIRTDLNKTFVLKTAGASTLSNWQELLTPTDVVTSVAGKTGVVTLTSSDVGLGNVTNESKTTMFTNTTLTGTPTAPTTTVDNNSTQIATTEYVKSQNYLTSAPVTSVASKTGDVTLVSSDVGLGNVTNESKTTMFTNPTFTGTGVTLPADPTANLHAVTKQYVDAEIAKAKTYAP
jgi:hypothetical protein